MEQKSKWPVYVLLSFYAYFIVAKLVVIKDFIADHLSSSFPKEQLQEMSTIWGSNTYIIYDSIIFFTQLIQITLLGLICVVIYKQKKSTLKFVALFEVLFYLIAIANLIILNPVDQSIVASSLLITIYFFTIFDSLLRPFVSLLIIGLNKDKFQN